jgi:uncharacterized protein (DUF697 family)
MANWRELWRRTREAWSNASEVAQQLWTNASARPADYEAKLAGWRKQLPTPVFWLIGKTQSGKTSILRYLTGATDALIGEGYRPTTRTTRRFDFPSAELSLLAFLDTRGLDEPGYDPQQDIAACSMQAHCVIVTVKVNDPAQATVRQILTTLRQNAPHRPVLLVLTCLHQADIHKPLPQPYPFQPYPAGAILQWPAGVSPLLQQQMSEQLHQFAGLYDLMVPVDLTRPEEGWPDPHYGGAALRQALIQLLPKTYHQTFLRWEIVNNELKDMHQRQASSVILSYSLLAASAGALPIPLADLPLIVGLQLRLAQQVAAVYGQQLRFDNYRELAAILGTGVITRLLRRQLAKLIPGLGSVVGAGLAFASTYALGQALSYYFETIHNGHIPDAATIERLYKEQFAAAEAAFSRSSDLKAAAATPPNPGSQ